MSNTTYEQENLGSKQGAALGITIVAAALLLVAGIVSILQGISALNNDTFFLVGEDYVYSFDLTTWGWIHLITGIIAVIIAGGLAVGADWARVCAIVIASVSIIANFLWLPQYPWWAIIVILLDLLVIWAVSTWSPAVLRQN